MPASTFVLSHSPYKLNTFTQILLAFLAIRRHGWRRFPCVGKKLVCLNKVKCLQFFESFSLELKRSLCMHANLKGLDSYHYIFRWRIRFSLKKKTFTRTDRQTQPRVSKQDQFHICSNERLLPSSGSLMVPLKLTPPPCPWRKKHAPGNFTEKEGGGLAKFLVSGRAPLEKQPPDLCQLNRLGACLTVTGPIQEKI